MLSQQEYDDICECIKLGSPIHAAKLISSINTLIKEAHNNIITKTKITNETNETNEQKGDE